MSDTAYGFSVWVFQVMERAFLWVYNLLRSGSLDFFLENWLWVAVGVSVAAFIIDHLLYFLKTNKEPLFIRYAILAWKKAKKGYYHVRHLINPEYVPKRAATEQEQEQEEIIRTREDGEEAGDSLYEYAEPDGRTTYRKPGFYAGGDMAEGPGPRTHRQPADAPGGVSQETRRNSFSFSSNKDEPPAAPGEADGEPARVYIRTKREAGGQDSVREPIQTERRDDIDKDDV